MNKSSSILFLLHHLKETIDFFILINFSFNWFEDTTFDKYILEIISFFGSFNILFKINKTFKIQPLSQSLHFLLLQVLLLSFESWFNFASRRRVKQLRLGGEWRGYLVVAVVILLDQEHSAGGLGGRGLYGLEFVSYFGQCWHDRHCAVIAVFHWGVDVFATISDTKLQRFRFVFLGKRSL